MKWPKAKFEFSCKQCGALLTLEGNVTSHQFIMGAAELSVRIESEGAIPWRVVGDDYYCLRHKVEVRSELIVDGAAVSEKRGDWV